MSNGNFGGGTGSSSDPYLVEDVADLRKCTKINTFYKQVADIDLAEFSDGIGFVPIKVECINSPINWGYDGNNYKILNLYQNNPNSYETGIFNIPIQADVGSNSAGSHTFTVSNINLINANITSKPSGMLVSCYTSRPTISNYSNSVRININNCFISGIANFLIDKNISTNFVDAGLIGSSVTNSSISYSVRTNNTYISNVMMVVEINFTVVGCSNKTYNISLLGHNPSPYGGNDSKTSYIELKNSCIHATISVDNQCFDNNVILNIYGLNYLTREKLGNNTSSQTLGVTYTLVNCYTNIELINVNNSEGVNLFYFTEKSNYVSNLIANHEKGKVPGIEFDNIHYLTEAQMKDLTYYKKLGWTVYE